MVSFYSASDTLSYGGNTLRLARERVDYPTQTLVSLRNLVC